MTSSRGGGSAQLPVEIWQQIAGHMSSRSWARVNRTCKAMHSVQPEQIGINVESESALAWVQTHWGQASNLRLRWLRRDIPWVMAHNAASVTALKRLELILLQEGSPTTVMLLTWLLAQAPQLQLLLLQHPGALVVPPIRNLRHLLMASNDFNPTTVASIRQLRNLQTLWLGDARPDRGVACAEFDLASLLQLSDVCVEMLRMTRISLPRFCRLHLQGFIQTNMLFSRAWSGIASYKRVQSINLQGGLFTVNMPQFLLDSKCSFLSLWDLERLGDLSSPALFDAAHFCCLTHLNLEGRTIHIVLPQELPLQVLHVQATEMLSIVCINPQEQAKRLHQLRVVYCTLRGADVFNLVGVMCGMGAMMSKVDVAEAVAGPEVQHGFLVSSRHVLGFWKCPCGACLDCLQCI